MRKTQYLHAVEKNLTAFYTAPPIVAFLKQLLSGGGRVAAGHGTGVARTAAAVFTTVLPRERGC